jgi:intracellular multiplication protein IcmW
MPDFSHQAVHPFWHQYPDPTIYRVITFMEGVEDWTADGHPQLEDALKRLGLVLDNIGKIELKQDDYFIDLVAHIKTGRGLRLLMSLDNAHPGSAAKVISKAEKNKNALPEEKNDDVSVIFIRRNIVFERLRLLSRVFSQDRFRLILKSLEESSYD